MHKIDRFDPFFHFFSLLGICMCVSLFLLSKKPVVYRYEMSDKAKWRDDMTMIEKEYVFSLKHSEGGFLLVSKKDFPKMDFKSCPKRKKNRSE
jgi:hypothetical protein